MQWQNFLCSSPPQSKLFSHDKTHHQPSKSKNRNTKSSKKLASPAQPPNDDSISALFVQEMNKQTEGSQFMRQIRDAVLEIRDIQKEKLDCAKKTLKILQEKTTKREKSTVKKKRTTTAAMEDHINTKLKQIDRLKLDLTHFMKRSRSTQKKHRQSHSIIKILHP